MNCKPKNFYGNEGVISLTRWFERMELVFHISFCPIDCKVRFLVCKFLDVALTWWKDQAIAMGVFTANTMNWEELKAFLIEEYCPWDKMQNIEHELWNLTMKGSEIVAYTYRFNDLAFL